MEDGSGATQKVWTDSWSSSAAINVSGLADFLRFRTFHTIIRMLVRKVYNYKVINPGPNKNKSNIRHLIISHQSSITSILQIKIILHSPGLHAEEIKKADANGTTSLCFG